MGGQRPEAHRLRTAPPGVPPSCVTTRAATRCIRVKTMPGTFTRADYDRLPEGFPAQLVEGLLVKEPSPTYGHQALASEIHAQLVSLVGARRALFAPCDVGLDDRNVYQPDLLVLKSVVPLSARDVGIPLIAVEVLCPSTARRDRKVKRRHLLAAGVAEVWIVDPDTRTVEMDDATGHRVARGKLTLSSAAVPGFALTPAQLFDGLEA